MRSVAVLFAVLAVASGVTASDYTWTLTNPSAGLQYAITGTGSVAGNNPTVTLPFSATLHLDITTDAAHPVCVQTNNAVTGASNYANVVPANPQCVQPTGTMDITLPSVSSGTTVLYLHCKFHSFAITINLAGPPSSSTAGPAAAVSSSTGAAQASTGAAASTGASGPDYTWALVNPTANDFFYTITGTGSVTGNNPTVTLPAGKRLHLDVTTTSSHPVCVQTALGVTGVSNYANTVPANPACVQTGTLDITLPAAGSGVGAIYLHCKFHSFAITINVDGGNAASGTATASAAVVLLATAAALLLRA